jgi:NADH-quinone oxidoreductase subunit L
MIGEIAVWAIFFLPLSSFVVTALVIRPFLNRYYHLSAILLIACLTAALALSIWALRSAIVGNVEFEPHPWLKVGQATIDMGLLVDPLTAVMLIVVTGVSLMIQVYSHGYMRHDPSYARYFAYMSLFTAAMVGLVLASNVIQLYVFWELVGFCSYLLIGFWHERPAAAAAAKKAFIITRIGDVGFLIAILYLFFQADEFAQAGLNAFYIPDIWQAAQPVAAGGAAILGGAALTWVALGIFSGAAGKSAQFPFHTWLPDAMEGPTPVSALIHAATMVAAGVFLVARFYPLFQEADYALTVVALIGAFTAFMAATMGLVMNDIKRVLAYSTISQLGYMMAGLGVGAYGPALFHLFTHAFFKALLFLGAGSVNHATGTFDLREMGGLRRYMPWTYLTVVIGALSLVGIIPLAGFWSKDEILLGAWSGNGAVAGWVSRLTFFLLAAGVLLTAFYTLRMIHLAFHGQFRGVTPSPHPGQEAGPSPAPTMASYSPGGQSETHAAAGPAHHLAESPVVMVLPMVVLGIAALVSGYLANPQWAGSQLLGIPKHWITDFLRSGLEAAVPPAVGHLAVPGFNPWLAAVSTGIALVGIALATALYLRSRDAAKRDPLESARPLHTLLSQKYYVDVLYEDAIVRRGIYRGLAGAVDRLDSKFVDGVVDLIGWVFRNIGRAIAQAQTGQVQFYAVVITLGSVLILVGFLVSRW